ncbi:hypothetical protein PAXRUDRAFT_40987, partial [Paxillus rubicundulus Ve08.2h10]
GHQISTKMQWAVICLSKLLDFKRTAMALDLSSRSVRHIVSYFNTHGTVPNPGENVVPKERQGNQHLHDVDVEFLLGTITKTPDLYLDELQEVLAVSCGCMVSHATIWRTLRRAGFTMKKVGIY